MTVRLALLSRPRTGARNRNAGTGCGLPDGLGESSHLSSDPDALWWIVDAGDAVDLDGKWKFPRATVVAFGVRHEVTAALVCAAPGPIHGLCLTGATAPR